MPFRTARSTIISMTALIATLCGSSAHSATGYIETDFTNFFPLGISPTGVMVGYTSDSSGNQNAATVTGGTVTDLGVLGGPYSDAYAQNSLGLTVGSSTLPGSSLTNPFPQHAASWQNGTATDLGCLGGCTYALAFGVNNAGTIVGTSINDSEGYTELGFVYQNGSLTPLGTLGGTSSAAQAINSSGEIVGGASTSTGDFHAAIFKDGSVIDLDNEVGRSSYAEAVNDSGIVAGYIIDAYPGSYSTQAAAWNANGVLTVLGDPDSSAAGINNEGQIVGREASFDANDDLYDSPDAWLWSDGQGQDLNTLVVQGGANVALVSAVGIADSGQIAAIGEQIGCDPLGPDCGIVGVLLTPLSLESVPESRSWAMIVIGFGIVGGFMRRRKTVLSAKNERWAWIEHRRPS